MTEMDQIRKELEDMSDEEIRLMQMKGASGARQAIANQVLEDRKNCRDERRFRKLYIVAWIAAIAAVLAAVASIGLLFV